VKVGQVAVTPVQWKRAIGPQLPTSDAWMFARKMCFRADPHWIALGLHGDGSGFMKDRVYVSILRFPLFVPTDHIDLSFSSRLVGSYTFDELSTSPRIAGATASIPRESEAMGDLAEVARNEQNCRVLETAGYAQVLLGNERRADKVLAKVVAARTDPEWVGEVVSRAASIRQLLATGGVEAATDRLTEWRDATVSALHLG
jgi:hypothetical protein